MTQFKLFSPVIIKKILKHIVLIFMICIGYAIFIDGNMAYRQPTIPAISGNKGFETVKQAENMAKYVIQKLKNGDNPPSVSPKEVENILSNQH